MCKKIAIKGEKHNGSDVIRILTDLGACNRFDYCGDLEDHYYFIDSNFRIDYDAKDCLGADYVKLTLDEYNQHFPFKIGDMVWIPEYESKVRINKNWWDGSTVMCSVFTDEEEIFNSEELKEWNGLVNETDKKIETLGFMQLGKTCGIIFNEANYEKEVELQLGNYEIVTKNGKTYAVLKPSRYPKTYTDCCALLGCDDKMTAKELVPLSQLVNARNAYWKLQNNWKPNYYSKLLNNVKYTIENVKGELMKSTCADVSRLLAFPTADMRDEFLDNFRELIEQCKEFI